MAILAYSQRTHQRVPHKAKVAKMTEEDAHCVIDHIPGVWDELVILLLECPIARPWCSKGVHLHSSPCHFRTASGVILRPQSCQGTEEGCRSGMYGHDNFCSCMLPRLDRSLSSSAGHQVGTANAASKTSIDKGLTSDRTHLRISQAQLRGQVVRCQDGDDAAQGVSGHQDAHVGRLHGAGLDDAVHMRNHPPAEDRSPQCHIARVWLTDALGCEGQRTASSIQVAPASMMQQCCVGFCSCDGGGMQG